MMREEYERLQKHLTKLLQTPPFEYQSGKRKDGWKTAILAAKSMLHSDYEIYSKKKTVNKMSEQQRRKKLNKKDRLYIFEKCKGHCAYCGRIITLQEMQVDHVIPLNGWREMGPDTLENMLPSCRSCNHYKSATTLELFRKRIERLPSVLSRDCVSFQIADRYGLVIQKQHSVIFYFEKSCKNDG